MMSDTGLSETVPSLEHAPHLTLWPVIPMTELNLTFHTEPCSWPLSLSGTSSQRRCDHRRLLSCHHTSLNGCETAVSSWAAALLGHMSSRIYCFWRLPAIPEINTWQPVLYGNITIWKDIVHIQRYRGPDNEREIANLFIFLVLQHFLIEMFTCSTRAFKEKAVASVAQEDTDTELVWFKRYTYSSQGWCKILSKCKLVPFG